MKNTKIEKWELENITSLLTREGDSYDNNLEALQSGYEKFGEKYIINILLRDIEEKNGTIRNIKQLLK